MFSAKVYISIFLICLVKSQDFTSLIDIDSLSELPLESLLNVRKNIIQLEGNDTIGERSDISKDGNDEKTPEALPLLGKISKKGGYYVQYGDEHSTKYEKKKSITTIFQLSVTTLAFLAFGGYLLYLVIAAIKGKNYNYMYDPNATQVMSAMINAQLNRRRRKKKPIRVTSQIGGYRVGHKRKNQKVKREVTEAKMNSETLYYALVDLCEGYTKFYGLDYAQTNFTNCYNSNTCSKIK